MNTFSMKSEHRGSKPRLEKTLSASCNLGLSYVRPITDMHEITDLMYTVKWLGKQGNIDMIREKSNIIKMKNGEATKKTLSTIHIISFIT